MQHTLLRNADVSVEQLRDDNGHNLARITIDDRIQHTFDASSRISKALSVATPKMLGDRLSGGQFFMVDDELHDFRDGNYSGFVHTDDSINHLVDVIGIMAADENTVRVHENTISNNVTLGAKWSNHEISIPQYRDGGDFESELHFGWSPFVQNVNSAFMLTRLICENGMRGLRSFLNTKIPLVNRWEEHLEIANRQIQHKVNHMVTERLTQMGSERATVAETALLANHAILRLNADVLPSETERNSLQNIINIVSPRRHLDRVYKDNVFTDGNIAAMSPAHLSTFDVYNIATELRSHTTAVENSTVRAIDRFSNDIVFDRKDKTPHTSNLNRQTQCSFSDPETAFFGQMH